jgi:hypothetical protein
MKTSTSTNNIVLVKIGCRVIYPNNIWGQNDYPINYCSPGYGALTKCRMTKMRTSPKVQIILFGLSTAGNIIYSEIFLTIFFFKQLVGGMNN